MIGFDITATSNIGFDRNRGAWTEGSLWLAKTALSKVAPKGTAMFTPDWIGAIESQFSNVKDALLESIGGIGNLFFLQINGDIMCNVKFNPAEPANVIVWKFLNSISLNNTELGDQVMIYLCKCISDFDEWICVSDTSKVRFPILTITLTL